MFTRVEVVDGYRPGEVIWVGDDRYIAGPQVFRGNPGNRVIKGNHLRYAPSGLIPTRGLRFDHGIKIPRRGKSSEEFGEMEPMDVEKKPKRVKPGPNRTPHWASWEAGDPDGVYGQLTVAQAFQMIRRGR